MRKGRYIRYKRVLAIEYAATWLGVAGEGFVVCVPAAIIPASFEGIR
jgi:hypothetical protein